MLTGAAGIVLTADGTDERRLHVICANLRDLQLRERRCLDER